MNATAANLHARFCSDMLGLEADLAPAAVLAAEIVANRPAALALPAPAVGREMQARRPTPGELDSWLDRVQHEIVDPFYAANFPRQGAELTIELGRRYAKVVRTNTFDGKHTSGRSVWGFVDMTNGDILKPASWRAPAKHARGNILGANPLAGCGVDGPAYLR